LSYGVDQSAFFMRGSVEMVCRPGVFSGSDTANVLWTNRDASTTRVIGHLFEPDALPDLVEKVIQATEQGRELHALGSGWAFEDLAVSPDWVISLHRLTGQLTNVVDAALTDFWQTQHNDSGGTRRLVHFEAGVEIGLLNDALAGLGLAMPTLGGANGQTLVGALATSTRGGDINRPPLPDVVRALHLVTVGGQELWIEPSTAPVTVDARLRAVLPCPDTKIIRDDQLSTLP
jgi:hypothetical protein